MAPFSVSINLTPVIPRSTPRVLASRRALARNDNFFDRLKPPKGWFFFIFRALRSKIDEARTRFPSSHEWQSHSQEPCLHLWI